jgi:hypothetical protein
MSKTKQKDTDASRRDFLRLAGMGTVGGGAALAAGAQSAAAAETRRADGSLGYRESEHVKTYYKLAKF